jgi:hypothetical protein
MPSHPASPQQDVCTVPYNTSITTANIPILGLAAQLDKLDMKFPDGLVNFILNKTNYLNGKGSRVRCANWITSPDELRLAVCEPHCLRVPLWLQ